MNRRNFIVTAAATTMTATTGMAAEGWQARIDPLILSGLTESLDTVLHDYVTKRMFRAGSMAVCAHAFSLWDAHMRTIGAVDDINAAMRNFSGPLSTVQMEQVREMAYGIASGPRVEILLSKLQQVNTPASVQKIRDMLSNGGVESVHRQIAADLMSASRRLESSGIMLAGWGVSYSPSDIIPVQDMSSFCDAVTVMGFYAAVWAYMGWAGYTALAAMMASGAAVSIALILAGIGVYCIGM